MQIERDGADRKRKMQLLTVSYRTIIASPDAADGVGLWGTVLRHQSTERVVIAIDGAEREVAIKADNLINVQELAVNAEQYLCAVDGTR